MKTKLPILLSAIAASASLAPAAVTITNGTFEELAGDNQNVPSWFDYKTGTNSGGDLIQPVAGPVGDVPAPTGTYWLNIVDNTNFDQARGVYQQIGTHDAGVTGYNITLTIGDRASTLFTQTDLVLFKGTGLTAADNVTPTVAGLTLVDSFYFGDFNDGSIVAATAGRSINLGVTGLSTGDTLWLAFQSRDTNADTVATQALFDDVVISAIPEPSAALLGGLGLLGLLASRRRS
jgi:hypothetical protein